MDAKSLFYGFFLLWFLLIAQRLFELNLANRHEQLLRVRGALEFGRKHYPWIVALHVCWLVGMAVEMIYRYSSAGLQVSEWQLGIGLGIFLLAQLLRYACIAALGEYWNTKVLVVPGVQPICRGPYRWLRHPNYLVVGIELFVVPASFGLWVAAFLGFFGHAAIMRFRIPVENEALSKLTEKKCA